MHAGAELARDVVGALEKISGMVDETTTAAKEISIATQQQRSASDQVVAAMTQVSDVSRQYAVGSKQAAAAATQLNSLAGDLRASITQFKLDDGDQAIPTTEKILDELASRNLRRRQPRAGRRAPGPIGPDLLGRYLRRTPSPGRPEEALPGCTPAATAWSRALSTGWCCWVPSWHFSSPSRTLTLVVEQSQSLMVVGALALLAVVTTGLAVRAWKRGETLEQTMRWESATTFVSILLVIGFIAVSGGLASPTVFVLLLWAPYLGMSVSPWYTGSTCC